MPLEEHRDRQLAVLRAFVLRARRIREHSLAKDAEALAKHQRPQWGITVDPETRKTMLRMEFLPEEQVESAAARVRPLILNDEATFHAKVMNALLFFANESGAPKSGIESLRKLKARWAEVKPNGTELRAYDVRVQNGDEPERRLSDNALGFAWIYGDVVHADEERREEGKPFGVVERFRAATPIVIKLMLLAMFTLAFIERQHKDGLLPELADAFEEDVVMPGLVWEKETTVFVADVGTDLGSINPDELGGEWQEFSDVMDTLIPTESNDDEAPQAAP